MGGRGHSKSGDPRDVLCRFLNQVARVERRGLFQEPWRLDSSWSIRAGVGQPTQFATQLPPRDDLDALLTSLRPILSADGSEIILGRVLHILGQRLRSDDLRAEVASIRAEFRTSRRAGIIGLRVDSNVLTPEHLLDLYINGEVFHDDQDKAVKLERLREAIPGISDVVMLGFIVTGLRCIAATAAIIREARDRNLLDP